MWKCQKLTIVRDVTQEGTMQAFVHESELDEQTRSVRAFEHIVTCCVCMRTVYQLRIARDDAEMVMDGPPFRCGRAFTYLLHALGTETPFLTVAFS
jgi:hypothetical protein